MNSVGVSIDEEVGIDIRQVRWSVDSMYWKVTQSLSLALLPMIEDDAVANVGITAVRSSLLLRLLSWLRLLQGFADEDFLGLLTLWPWDCRNSKLKGKLIIKLTPVEFFFLSNLWREGEELVGGLMFVKHRTRPSTPTIPLTHTTALHTYIPCCLHGKKIKGYLLWRNIYFPSMFFRAAADCVLADVLFRHVLHAHDRQVSCERWVDMSVYVYNSD